MADATPPPDASHAPLGNLDELNDLWTRFRTGAMVLCPADQGPLALAVDASVGIYRFVCTQCGVASPWFESGPDGAHIRGSQPNSSRGGGGGGGDE
jgi:hypothetical protein